jgi:GntR family transcriptional regulator
LQLRRHLTSASINDGIPFYLRLQKIILDKIEEGIWKPDEMIPTEAQIADTYKVSVGTVKKSILNLINEGYLYRVQGKGTFVAGTSLARDQLRYYLFFSNFQGEAAQFKMRFLSLKSLRCPEAIRRLLAIKSDDHVYRLERLSLCNNAPMIYMISRLRKEMFPDLGELATSQFERIPLYTLIETKYGMPTISNHELISAVTADRQLAQVLNIKENTPLLRIEMLSFTYKETPYEHRVSYCLTNQRRLFRVI